MKDHVSWIRDLSAERLVQSAACNASPSCRDSLLADARQMLRSKNRGKRWEALKWLEPLTEPIGNRKTGPNGLPPMSNSTVRRLLLSVISDRNLAIGDKAFGELAMFDFHQTAHPGECIEIVPALRRSATWTHAETKDVSIGNPLGNAFTCIP
jgi:hypothetical protein